MPGLSFSYQWLLDGLPIEGEADRSYRVGRDDMGHGLAIRVTASRRAFDSGEATSPIVVPKTDAVMSARLAKREVQVGRTGRVIVTLSADGVRPTGLVQVLTHGVVIGSRALPASRKNRVSIRLAPLSPGAHSLEIVYSGDSEVNAKSVHRRLRVRGSEPRPTDDAG
jgi:hypothetical protein